jgi:hypothetical protein
MIVGIIFTIMISSCSQKESSTWPWWTSADSIAVMSELTLWRDTLNGFHYLSGQNNASLYYPLDVVVPLVSSDTISSTGDSLVKIGHFLDSSYITLGDRSHFDDLLFEVKNDTIETRDTFCFVTYKDSTQNCICVLHYDSLWTVKFYQDTLLDTIGPIIDTIIDTIPPQPDTTFDTTGYLCDTTFIYPLDTIIKTGSSSVLKKEIHYSLASSRKLELKKDTVATVYHLANLTGFGTYIPNSTDAPTISNVILTKTMRIDTFFYGARLDRKGIYNPKSLDSLYTIAKNETITVKITTSTPSDTVTDRNYFFVSCGLPYVTSKHHITISPIIGYGKVAFSQSGLNHLYVEVIPASALFYPYAQWKSTTWAIPVRVTP